MAVDEPHRDNSIIDLPDAKQPWLTSTVLRVSVDLPARVLEHLCGRNEIDAMLANIGQLFLDVPNEVAGAEIHYRQCSYSMAFCQYYKPYQYPDRALTIRCSRRGPAVLAADLQR